MTLEILDCTLRDGGYNNAWDFGDAVVDKYLGAISRTGVSYVEMGYRAPASPGPAGAYRYCSDSLLRAKRPGPGVQVAVMVDGKTLCESGVADDPARVAGLFGRRSDGVIDVVRIAATASLVPSLRGLCESLHQLGYRIAVNIMQGSVLDVSSLAAAAKQAADAPITFLYVADSFGGLTPDATARRIEAMAKVFTGRLGFHAHDNLGLALANTLAAVDAGATIVDASVRGMGRGAGNVKTEQLLAALRQQGNDHLAPEPLFGIVENDFAALQGRYGWGATAPYMVTGANNIHPTYAQELISRAVQPAESMRVLTALARLGARTSYDGKVLDALLGARQPVRAADALMPSRAMAFR